MRSALASARCALEKSFRIHMKVVLLSLAAAVAAGGCCEPQQYKCCTTDADCCTNWGALQCSVGVCVFPGAAASDVKTQSKMMASSGYGTDPPSLRTTYNIGSTTAGGERLRAIASSIVELYIE